MIRFLTALDVDRRLRQGDRFHMELNGSERQWWFEGPLEYVSDRIASAMLGSSVREAGDSLFGLPLNSQTWLARNGCEATNPAGETQNDS